MQTGVPRDNLSLQSKCLHPSTGKLYMKSMRMGKNRSWEPFSKGMTHGFMFEFKNQDDLDYYLTQDPMHKAFSQAAKDLVCTFITLKSPQMSVC